MPDRNQNPGDRSQQENGERRRKISSGVQAASRSNRAARTASKAREGATRIASIGGFMYVRQQRAASCGPRITPPR